MPPIYSLISCLYQTRPYGTIPLLHITVSHLTKTTLLPLQVRTSHNLAIAKSLRDII